MTIALILAGAVAAPPAAADVFDDLYDHMARERLRGQRADEPDAAPPREHAHCLLYALATDAERAQVTPPAPRLRDNLVLMLHVREAARRFALSEALILAVIEVESGFDSQAISKAGARGLMQLMPETARHMGVRDPLTSRDNVLGGCRYLRALYDQFGGQLALALAAYNAGPNAVRRYGGVPPFAETQHYVGAVLARYRANLERQP